MAILNVVSLEGAGCEEEEESVKKVKYTFALPEDTANKLNELSKLDSMSKPGVMRKAMEVYYFIHSEKKNGMKFFMSDKEGSEYKEIVFL